MRRQREKSYHSNGIFSLDMPQEFSGLFELAHEGCLIASRLRSALLRLNRTEKRPALRRRSLYPDCNGYFASPNEIVPLNEPEVTPGSQTNEALQSETPGGTSETPVPPVIVCFSTTG
jgi:hypothetical protein